MSGSLRHLARALLEGAIPGRAARFWKRLVTLADLAGRELRTWRAAGLPLRFRLKLWRRGFLSDDYVLYGSPDLATLERDYLSDADWYFRSGHVNGDMAAVLDSKVLFYLVLRHYTQRVVPVLGTVAASRFTPLDPDVGPPAGPALHALGGLGAPVFLRPVCGSGGHGAFLYERRDGVHRIDGVAVGEDVARRRLAGPRADERGDELVVSPVVRQAAYARAIHPGSANTIRLITMWDDDRGRAFVARAVHRFGARASGVVDNVSRGGLTAGVDVESGVLGHALTWKAGAARCRVHPDSGAPIEGQAVPGWASVKAEVEALASRLPFLPYVGWDIVVTDDGFAIIEGNNRPGVDIVQVHGPLLADEAVRRFYARRGVLRACRPAAAAAGGGRGAAGTASAEGKRRDTAGAGPRPTDRRSDALRYLLRAARGGEEAAPPPPGFQVAVTRDPTG